MQRARWSVLVVLVLMSCPAGGGAQEAAYEHLFTRHFPPEAFARRRAWVLDAIGNRAIALIQGAPSPRGYEPFRQSNTFFYLCGIETPHAYLILDGRTRRTRLYLPHRNPRRDRFEGKLLAAEDADWIRTHLGIDEVYGVDLLSEHLARYAWTGAITTIYTPLEPAEGAAMARDLAHRGNADIAGDPWDGRPSREGHFVQLLRARFPKFEIRNLSPILDRLRRIKTPREIAMIRRATRIAGAAILAAMRATEPGIYEYELRAVADFVFIRNGARGPAYFALIASGPNATIPHYHTLHRRMQAGELVLMDYAPDYGYYASDVTRMWPVDGKFRDWQRELYGFYLAAYRAILRHIRPGVTVQDVKRAAAEEMRQILARTRFSKTVYQQAAQRFVEQYARSAANPDTALGHGVGLSVHDVGRISGELVPGLVFTIEPALTVPEERIYIRLEDVIAITEQGVEVLSDFVPTDMAAIERVMKETGMLQRYPRLEWTGPVGK